MTNSIYQTKNGVKRKLSNKEIKAFIMKERGWTTEQYNKEYDKLRNKLRTYEAYEAQSDVNVTKQSPAHILYYEAKAMKRRGANYQRSIALERINAFPSLSTGKALQKALKNPNSSFGEIYREATDKAFNGLINANPKAKEISEKITDPVKREQALKDYVEKLHAKQNENGEYQAGSAIPFGQAVGSDLSIDFDIEKYM